MATKKQSSAKQSSAESAAASAETQDAAPDDTLHVEPTDGGGELIPFVFAEAPAPDFAALESRVAQADAAHGAAVASVGTTADELREARAALREARGG
jgi:hypothetical protein